MLEEYLFSQLAIPGIDILVDGILESVRLLACLRKGGAQIVDDILQFRMQRSLGILALLHFRQRPILCEGVEIADRIDQHQRRRLFAIEASRKNLSYAPTNAMS